MSIVRTVPHQLRDCALFWTDICSVPIRGGLAPRTVNRQLVRQVRKEREGEQEEMSMRKLRENRQEGELKKQGEGEKGTLRKEPSRQASKQRHAQEAPRRGSGVELLSL